MDQWLWRRSISLHTDPVGEHGGGSLTRDSEGQKNFQGMGCRRFCRQVSLSIQVPLGNLGRGPFTGKCERQWKEGSGNGASLFTGALLGEPGGIKHGSGDGHLFPWGPRWETLEEGSYAGSLCVEEGSGTGVSPYTGTVGEPGEGGLSTGNFEN